MREVNVQCYSREYFAVQLLSLFYHELRIRFLVIQYLCGIEGRQKAEYICATERI